MTKKYTLTTSEETVTENPEDIIRLMKLAGLSNAQPVAEEEVTEEVEAEVYEPTEANDKLDLDDYSKKSPESIAKQKKSIQPTLGDNPLEYSLDENEINEALAKEFDKTEEVTEEKLDEIVPLIPAAVKAVGKGIKAVSKSDQVKTILKPEKVKFPKGGGFKPGSKAGRATAVTMPEGDKAVEGTYKDVIVRPKTVSASRKSPTIIKPVSPADKAKADATNYASDEKLIKKAVNRKRNYNDDGIAPPSGHHNNTSNRWAESTEEVTEAQSPAQKAAFAKMLAAKNGKKDETKETKETKETTVEENLQKAEEQIKTLKEGCSCGHGSDCGCGPECGCGCNAVNEATWPSSVDRPHVNGSRDTEDLERIVRAYWDDLPEKLQMDLDMHFDTLKGEFDESQDRMAQLAGIKK